jgi:DNA helicase-2/ATP-dependent DNA helicase PcrA
MPDTSGSRLNWAERIDRAKLAETGHAVVGFAALKRQLNAASPAADAVRTSLANPAQAWLDRVAAARHLAIVDVRIETVDDLAILHGYVLEPALRSGTVLTVECAQRITKLDPMRFVESPFEYPYTLERALDAAMRLHRGDGWDTEPGGARGAIQASLASSTIALDSEQLRAIGAQDGVVQVIAPAGSGKTSVLIERVRELLHRGARAERILCLTFNRAAADELRQRLLAAGVGGVEARTFHGLGWRLMREEGLARPGDVRQLNAAEWKRLCTIARRETGDWIDPADAVEAISAIKLGLLMTPLEYRRRATNDTGREAIARIYELYERHLADQRRNDHDDQILLAVRALREDNQLRGRWQGRFSHVLVDEYQDIEPAQELLVRILAAPQDRLFCVGDEDQTLYGWRRASVQRIIDLDRAYPGLQRVALAHNYRCPAPIVDASRKLIEHNHVRFPKEILSGATSVEATGTTNPDALTLHEHASQERAAEQVARALNGRSRGEIVVLARTTNLLRTVALACAALGVQISAPERVFQARGARAAIEAYVRLGSTPLEADADDIVTVCRTPSRGLPLNGGEQVAGGLRAGLSFAAALEPVPAPARDRERLHDAGVILDTLAAISDARRFVRYLRGPGGLDEFFAEQERIHAGAESIELEVLEHAERDAAGLTLRDYAALLRARADALLAIRDDLHGIELATIHGAKGRQWPAVHLFACEENQLPHRHALDPNPQERAVGEGVEAERRLAYVAFTRAQTELAVHTTATAASRFLSEAGLAPSQPYAALASAGTHPRVQGRSGVAHTTHANPTVTQPARRAPTRVTRGPDSAVVAQAQRIGLSYALRTANSRHAALHGAAHVIERRLIGEQTTSSRMTAAELLAAIAQLTDTERDTALATVSGGGQATVARLGEAERAALVRALRTLAARD